MFKKENRCKNIFLLTFCKFNLFIYETRETNVPIRCGRWIKPTAELNPHVQKCISSSSSSGGCWANGGLCDQSCNKGAVTRCKFLHQTINFCCASVRVCDMTLLGRERAECAHNPPLHRDRLHCASVHILSFAVVGSDTQHIFVSTKSKYLLLCSMPPIHTCR